MKERLTSTLFIILALHLFLSLLFILNPGTLMNTRISRIYRTYLLPGPFFDANRIINSYSLYLSWKSNGHWSIPICPAKDNFIRYNRRFNPTDIYQSRFERTLYQGLVLKPGQSAEGITRDKGFQQLKGYLSDRYVPREADSIRLLITRKKSQHFKTSLDTLYIIAQK